MKGFTFFISAVMLVIFDAQCAVKINNNKIAQYQESNDLDTDDATTIATLENDISILDSEIEKCEKQKKGWMAATIVGGTGVVGTGIAAAVQGVQIKEKKDVLDDKTSQWNALKKEKENLK